MAMALFTTKTGIKIPFSPQSFQILIHISHSALIPLTFSWLRVIDDLSLIYHPRGRSITRLQHDAFAG